jgi:hypothetical protein
MATREEVLAVLDRLDISAGTFARFVSVTTGPISVRDLVRRLSSGSEIGLHRSQVEAAEERIRYEIGLSERLPPS